MELAAKLLAGAIVGGLLGLLIARARACSSEACHVRANLIFSVVAGAVFGAAVAWYFVSR